MSTFRPLGYERVSLPLCEVADTPFHIQGDDLFMFEFELHFVDPILYFDWSL